MQFTHLSGWLLLASLLLSLTGIPLLYTLAGLLAWGAGVLLFPSVPNEKRTLIYVLFGAGVACFGYALWQDFSVSFTKALSINQIMLSLLISVNYLKLVALPKKESHLPLPQGKRSFVMTFFGVHLFGSIINLSAILLAADRLYQKAALSRMQITMLARAFSTDALWSPFFVAFAAASIYAPEASILGIWKGGFALVFVAFLLTYWEFRGKKMDTFVGYPIRPHALILPAVLALLVWMSHLAYPAIKVIVLVSLFSFLLTLLLLLLREGLRQGARCFVAHTTTQVPLIKMELLLFLVAGFFGVGISTLLEGFNLAFPVREFTPIIAAIMLFGMVSVSFIGIHPIISIAVLGSWLEGLHVDHTLLAMTFLMSWSLSICTSPVSGLNLAISGRYNIPARSLFMWNIGYAFKLYLACVVILLLYNFAPMPM